MDAGLGRGGIDAGLGRGGMPGWLGRGIPDGDGRPEPPETPNGLLPGPRDGGRGAPPPGPGRTPPGAPGAGGRAAGEPGRGGTAPGPGRGREMPSEGGCCARRSASRTRAACAALTAASCSAFNAEARASAAATSMSWALAGLATGPGMGPGRPGTAGLGRAIWPGPGAGEVGTDNGAGEVGASDRPELGEPLAGVGRRGGWGRAPVGLGRAAGAAAAGDDEAEDAGAAEPASRAPRSRRATGASTVLDADLTNSPISLSLARTVLLSTPSSFASSCTRALPGTALLTSRSCEQHPQRPHSCTRSLVISGTSSCAHLGRPTLLVVTRHEGRVIGRPARPRRPNGCARPAIRCQGHRRGAAHARRRDAAPPARSRLDRGANALPGPAVGGSDQAGAGDHPRSPPQRTESTQMPPPDCDSQYRYG
jgi:hypothetical protein